ncbi:MAG: hypothetical protein ACFB21_08255 [Opitutales bacterium]
MMPRTALIAALILTFANVLFARRHFRVWRDVAGAEVTADFVGRVGDRVWLQREDGALLDLRPVELSERDNVHLSELQAVASANATVGLPGPGWSVDPTDEASAKGLRALTQARAPALTAGAFTLGEALAAIQKAVQRQTELGWNLQIVLSPETLAETPLKVSLTELPAQTAIEDIARTHGLRFELRNGDVYLAE